MALRLESKAKATRQTPSLASNLQLLHLRVARAFQSIDAWPPEVRAKLFEQFRMSKPFHPEPLYGLLSLIRSPPDEKLQVQEHNLRFWSHT
jgi:hypothetical protein